MSELMEEESRLCSLVWYERTLRYTDEQLAKMPPDIRKGRDAAKARIEDEYPEEVAAITNHDEFIADPFQVGLNLGKLMAIRWASGEEANNGDT